MLNDTVTIVNFKQACAYISDGVKPVDIEYDLKNRVMVFYFDKDSTKSVWQKWKNKEYWV